MKIPRRVSPNNHSNGETKGPSARDVARQTVKRTRGGNAGETRESWSAVKQSDARLSPPLIVRHKASETTSTFLRLKQTRWRGTTTKEEETCCANVRSSWSGLNKSASLSTFIFRRRISRNRTASRHPTVEHPIEESSLENRYIIH